MAQTPPPAAASAASRTSPAASASPTAGGMPHPPAAPATKLIDRNTASAGDLDALPGIGAARAGAIIANRPYRRKDDLVSRHIISQSVYDGINDKIIAKQN